MTRIRAARLAAIRAKNQWFKNYWNEVADTLEVKLVAYDETLRTRH